MTYILFILFILLITSFVIGKRIRRDNIRREEYNDKLIKTKENESFFKGRKTEADWNTWYKEVLSNKN